MGLEDGDDLLLGMSITLHREISGYQGKRKGKITLTVGRFLGERSQIHLFCGSMHALICIFSYTLGSARESSIGVA